MTDKPGVVEVRAETRDTYRSYLKNHPDHPDITVHHAGPTLGDDGESITGLVVVLEAPSLAEARSFLADSPYAKAGVFAECEVREWDWLTGRPA
ncbi:MAG: YciI family protein [Gammaproteobacteria bacterium]|nr:YciI family protein [Gammaproteobacteria bacterium]